MSSELGTQLRGKTALVTGGSGGLGADFARILAARGANLVLVARREDLLNTVRDEIASKHKVRVDIVVLDLGTSETPQELYDRLKGDGTTIDVLVNNAGFGLYGRFAELEWERQRSMLQLDILALTHPTRLFVADMVGRKFGYVLHVASIGAFQPTPLYATYSAAKAYVLSFGEALDYELRGTGVHSTVIAPGITATEFLKVSGQDSTLYQRMTMMQSPAVACIGIDAMLKGRSSVVSGTLNAVSAWSNRLIPRRVSASIAYRLMKSN